MTHIVSVSGGLSSYYALKRTIEKHGKENTVSVFADVGEAFDEQGRRVCGEDLDLYRFLEETEELLGSSIIRLKNPKYKNIWDVFFSERFLGNTLKDPCSKMMKRKVIFDWVKKNYTPENATLVLGFSWLEVHRADEYAANLRKWKVEFPLIEPPFVTNIEIAAELLKHGIKQPRLYDLGFSHNNCGGFCVKMGLGQAHDLWKLNLPAYLFHEGKEMEFRRTINPDVTIFRKNHQPITMFDLRLLFEAGYIPRTANQKGCGGRCMVPTTEEMEENEITPLVA